MTAVARRRWRKNRVRSRAFVASGPGLTLPALIDRYGGAVETLYLTGPRPGGGVDGFGSWLAAELPDGWAPAGHYLARLHRPVLRFERRDGAAIEIHRAASWFGEREVTPSDASDALDLLDLALSERFDEWAHTLATPATTGRDLWLRSLPDDAAYPALTDEQQTLIRSTSGQGRWELFTGERGELDELHGFDMRFGYAALLWGLGVGPAEHDDRNEYAGQRRGRYRVRATVPAGWDHVGLLPYAEDDGATWTYPDEPGRTFTTWADGAEVHVALAHGWQLDILERLLLQDGRPLDGWQRRMIDVRDRLADAYTTGETDRTVAKLAADAARLVLLSTVGAFHGAPRAVTRSAERTQDIPADAEGLDFVDGRWSWTETTGAAWPETSHPEWATAIWARCRARILTHRRSGTGALHVPRRSLVAIRQDAIYLDHHPGWTDDGSVGRLRHTTAVRRRLPAPRTPAELLEVTR